MPRHLPAATALFLLATLGPPPAGAGVVNPDLSVFGQPFMHWTDDPSAASPRRITFDQGEVETVYDAYLNPYAKGYFVTSLGTTGLALEEGYFTLVRGLPGGLELKGGKYRVGYGKLNPMHYGQQHILPSGSGNSAPMAKGSLILPCITVSGIRRPPALREAGLLRPYCDQEDQLS